MLATGELEAAPHQPPWGGMEEMVEMVGRSPLAQIVSAVLAARAAPGPARSRPAEPEVMASVEMADREAPQHPVAVAGMAATADTGRLLGPLARLVNRSLPVKPGGLMEFR